MPVIGKRHHIEAMTQLQRAFVADGTKDLREAIVAIEHVVREARAWSNEIEDEITRKELEEHAQHEIGRTEQ